jgi:hypothetical protein
MGVVIFTHDAQKYRVGNYIEGNEITADPRCEGLTVIVQDRNPKAKTYLDWLPYVAHRLVVVCETPPKVKNESVIFDGKFSKDDYIRDIDATMRWNDRAKTLDRCARIPIPLMLSFLRANNKDIRLWRNLAHGFTHVPESFQSALINFGHKPVRRMNYPKKKKSAEELPNGIRLSDIHWQSIIKCDTKSANSLRNTNKELLPNGMKKTQQGDGWL